MVQKQKSECAAHVVDIEIDVDICRQCGSCAKVCPESVFAWNNSSSTPEITQEEFCFSCGHCVAMCQSSAITHSSFQAGDFYEINRTDIPTPNQLIELLRSRRSTRAFTSAPLSKEEILNVIEGAAYAPSAHNEQTTEFLVVEERSTIRSYTEITVNFLAKTHRQLRNPFIRNLMLLFARKEITGVLPLLKDFERIEKEFSDQKDTVLFNAPTLVIFHADTRINYSHVNAALAVQNAMLVCESLGLGSFYTGYFVEACRREKALKNMVNLPKHHAVFGALAIGKPMLKHRKWITRDSAKIEWR